MSILQTFKQTIKFIFNFIKTKYQKRKNKKYYKYASARYFRRYLNPLHYIRSFFAIKKKHDVLYEEDKRYFAKKAKNEEERKKNLYTSRTPKSKTTNKAFDLRNETPKKKKERIAKYEKIKSELYDKAYNDIKILISKYGYYSHDAMTLVDVTTKRNAQRNKYTVYLNIKPSNINRFKAYKHYASIHNVVLDGTNPKLERELFKVFLNILILKAKIRFKKTETIRNKGIFLSKVLKTILYVEDIEAENINEKLAKSFFYTRDVDYNFRVRSSNIKVRSLEWTISSPPPLHTFYVPVRTIVTNDRFFNYKKGKRLLQNKYYDFTEMPSIFQKGMRKITKTYYLSRNYLYHALGLKDYSKDNNLWYKDSYYVEESQEYSHTVEYVSQAVRYPYKHLSKHLPFSAGLHKNTISIDLLITSDKSNKVLFGEKKSLLFTKKFLNINSVYIKPLFIVGNRLNPLVEVRVKWLDNNYTNYLILLDRMTNEFYNKGDGFLMSYYLPALRKNTFHFYIWNLSGIEHPKWFNFFNENIFYDPYHLSFNSNKYDVLDNVIVLLDSKKYGLFSKICSYFNIFVKNNNSIRFICRDWYDIQDFSQSSRIMYTLFYMPYVLAKKTKRSHFIRYFLYEFLFKSISGIEYFKLFKSDYYLLPNWYRQLTKKYRK